MSTEPVVTPEPLSLRFRHPPPWSRSLNQFAALLVAGWVVLLVVPALAPQALSGLVVFLLWIPCALVLAVGARLLFMPPTLPPLRFLEDGISVPRPPYGRRPVWLGYAEIFDVHIVGPVRRRRIVVGLRERFSLLIRSQDLLDEDAPERFRNELRARIRSLVDGEERIRDLDQREVVAAAASEGTPWLTWVLFSLLVGVFVAQTAIGWDLFFEKLVRIGANSGLLVARGEWFRLVTANFLHFGVQHLVLNSVMLLALGYLLERLLGRDRFFTLVVISGIAGAGVSSLLGSAPLSVGFSTSVFGLIGALAYLNILRRPELPSGLRIPGRWAILIALVELLSEWFLPGIDWLAHVGGLTIGWAVAWLMFHRRALVEVNPGRLRAVCAMVAGLLVFAGLVQGLRNVYAPNPESALVVADAVLLDPGPNPFSENEVAWLIATTPSISRERLEVARGAMQKAVEIVPNSDLIRDTLATLHFRLGDYDRAVEEEMAAYEVAQSVFMGSQLARFEAARAVEHGPFEVGAKIEPWPDLSWEGDPVRLVFETRTPFPEGGVLHFSGYAGSELVGYAWARFGPIPALSMQLDGQALGQRHEGIRFELSRIETGPNGLAAGAFRWHLAELDPQVAILP